MPEVTEAFLQQFVEGLQSSASAQAASAAATIALTVELKEQAREARDSRERAVVDVKQHFSSALKAESRWPRMWLAILAAAATVTAAAISALAFIAARKP